jgi:hypothetical protein
MDLPGNSPYHLLTFTGEGQRGSMTDPGGSVPPEQPWQPPGQPWVPPEPPSQPGPPGYWPPPNYPPPGQPPPGYPPLVYPGSADYPLPGYPPPPAGQVHYALDGLAAALTVLLAASAAATVVSIGLPGAGIVALLLRVALIPVFLVWFYRARKDANGRGQRQRWSPGWAIGAWFVPIVYLWFPYQIMADIWRANLSAERRNRPAVLPGFWWGCWLVGEGFTWGIAGSSTGAARVVVGLAGLVAAAAAILLIVIVRTVTNGPVGREPASASPGPVPQEWVPQDAVPQDAVPQDSVPQGPVPQGWVTGSGPAYPAWDNQDGRRRAARAGYVISALGVVAITAVSAGLYWLAAGPTSARTRVAAGSTPAVQVQELTLDELQAGDCLKGDLGLGTSSPWPDLIEAVPCAKEHIAEVFYSDNYWPDSKAFPGNDAINSQAMAQCYKAFQAYDGIMNSASLYSFDYIAPDGRQDWNSGDRQVACIAYEPTSQHPGGEPLHSSIKGSNQ